MIIPSLRWRLAARLAALCLIFPAVGCQGAEAIPWLWDEARQPAGPSTEAAVLQRHILLSGARILTRPRMRRATLSPGTRITPVVHVDISIVNPPTDMEAARPVIVQAMQQAAQASTSGRVQLDMEARPSQRIFYRSLVRQLRELLPPSLTLSVTALAWWCRSPAWLDDLAADEVVPMFFRMGKDSAALRQLVQERPDTLHARCRTGSAGFSPQEAFPAGVAARYGRNYWFDYHAWKSPQHSPLTNFRTGTTP